MAKLFPGVHLVLSRNADFTLEMSCSTYVTFFSFYFLKLIFFIYFGSWRLFSIFQLFWLVHVGVLVQTFLRCEILLQIKSSVHVRSSVHLIRLGRLQYIDRFFHVPKLLQLNISQTLFVDQIEKKFVQTFAP